MKTAYVSNLIAALALTLASGTSGCADEDPTQTGNPFPCLNIECDSGAGEFCLYQVYAGSDGTYGARCIAPTEPCSTCECAKDAALEEFGGANNCGGWIACSYDNDEITVTCKNARWP